MIKSPGLKVPCNLEYKNADATPNFLRPQGETDMVGVQKSERNQYWHISNVAEPSIYVHSFS